MGCNTAGKPDPKVVQHDGTDSGKRGFCTEVRSKREWR